VGAFIISFKRNNPFSIREKVAEGRMREKSFDNSITFLFYKALSLTCPSDILSLRERRNFLWL